MPLFWLIGLVVFALGAAIGSFLNVLVYRTQHGSDWVKGRSRCEHCHKKISWYENIPLLSFLFLRGRCSRCHKRIDVIHPLIELLTGALFAWWYAAGYLFFRLSSSPMQIIQPFYWLMAGVLLVMIAAKDLKYMLISRWGVIVLTLLTLFYRIALLLTGEMQMMDFVLSIAWSLLLVGGFFLLWAGTKGKGFGFGDVQLAFPLGLILASWQRIIVAVFAAFVIGALVGLILVMFKKKRFKQAVPFGPFLILGSAISLVWGFEIWSGYVRILGG